MLLPFFQPIDFPAMPIKWWFIFQQDFCRMLNFRHIEGHHHFVQMVQSYFALLTHFNSCKWTSAKLLKSHPAVVLRCAHMIRITLQGCAKQVGFDTNIGFDIENSRKYRYRIDIGYEIARDWISKSISFWNNELTDIGFVFDFEILNGRILEHFRDNF